MGAIIIDRLSKLGPQDVITAYCSDWRCPMHTRGRDLDVVALRARYGDLELAHLPGRLRCSACGHRPGEIRHGWCMPAAAGVGWVAPRKTE